MMKLYENIRMYRKRANFTQDELARRAGYTDRSSIAKIEKGIVDLPQTKIKQFADIFGVSPSTLMGWDEGEEKNDTVTIGNLFEHLRKERNLSLTEFSEETGLSVEEIRKYETGKGGIPSEIVKMLAEYFGISYSNLSAGRVKEKDIFAAFASTNEAYVEQVTKWVEVFGNERFSDEEFEKIIDYAKFILSQRENKK